MPIDKQKLEEFEKKYKDTIFNKIAEAGSKQFEGITQMETNARNLGQSQVRIPNANTTLNNKLVELSHEFKRVGLSMFSKELEGYDMAGFSLIGDAIIYDLIDKLTEARGKLGEYSKTMGDVSKQRNERLLALQNVSPIRKFFSRIRAFFVPVKPIDLSLTEEEQGTLDSSLQEYIDIDSEIWNYNLEDNMVQALVKEIAGPEKVGSFDIKHKYDANMVPGLLEESVIPDLKKLGLEHLVPRLQEALIKEYKKDLPDPEIYQVKDEDMHLYVPDFSQKPEEQHKDTKEELQDMMLQQAQEVINGSKKTLRSIRKERLFGGLGLKSFANLDLSVSASERQVAVSNIGTELSNGRINTKEDMDNTIEEDKEFTIN